MPEFFSTPLWHLKSFATNGKAGKNVNVAVDFRFFHKKIARFLHLRGRVITVLCVVRGRDIVFASKRVTSAERVAGVSQWYQWTSRIFLYPPIPKKFFGLSPDPFKNPVLQLAFYAFFSKTRVFAHSFLVHMHFR